MCLKADEVAQIIGKCRPKLALEVAGEEKQPERDVFAFRSEQQREREREKGRTFNSPSQKTGEKNSKKKKKKSRVRGTK